MNQQIRLHRVIFFSCFILAAIASSATVREVNSTADNSSPGTLRNAVEASQDGDSIIFNLFPGAVINLGQGHLTIGSEITIVGPGTTNLTIQNFSGNIFRINAGAAANVHISGIRFEASPSGGFPGAIYGNNLQRLTIKNCEFYNCSSFAPPGGGAISMSGNTELIIDSTKFEFNNSSSNNGGAIYIANNSKLFSYDCEFTLGFAGAGGAIAIDGTNSEFHIERSTFYNNDASNLGGAIYSNSVLNSNKIIQSTFYNNRTTGSAGSNGGGLFINGGIVEIVNSTFANNTAGDVGGGIQVENGIARISSVYLGGNQGEGSPNDISIGAGTLDSQGKNFIETSTPNTGNATDIQGVNDGAGRGSFANHGGFTQTMAILQTSVAVDAGVDNGYSTDQNGKARQSGFGADIGAFEYQYVPVIPTITSIEPGFGVCVFDTVIIRGSGFATTNNVYFLGVTLGVADYTLISDDSIEVYIPAGVSNSSDVRVETPAGTSSPANYSLEIPYINELDPSEAFAGDTVRVFGGALVGIDSISVAGIKAEIIQSYGKDSLDIKIPSGIVGSVSVEVHSSVDFSSPSYLMILSCPSSNIVYVDNSATGDGSGHSWGDGLYQISSAISLANACPIIDQVWIAQGTYYTSGDVQPEESIELKSNLALYGGFQSGGGTTLDDRDPYNYETTIDGEIGGGDDYNYHIISATNVTGAIIDGLTLKNARSDGPSAGNQDIGGGLFVNNSVVHVKEVSFLFNSAEQGGAVAVINGGHAHIERSKFQDNSASLSGGAIVVKDPTDSVTVYSSYFVSNMTLNPGGQGAAIENHGVAWIENSIFDNNTAFTIGSAIANETTGVLDIINCTLSKNEIGGFGNRSSDKTKSRRASSGGALFNFAGGNYRVKNSIFWGNRIGSDENDPTSEIEGDPSTDATAIEYSNIQGVTLGGTNFNVDPQFINPVGEPADFKVQLSSEMVNSGNNGFSTQSKDYQGEDRIKGSAVDIGAYEMCNPLEVYSTADDTICGTLRYAMMFAEMNTGSDTITFALPINSTIAIDSALPVLKNGNVVINGDMNNDGIADVVLKNNGSVLYGLHIENSSSNVINGLRIIDFSVTNGAGIKIDGSGSTGNVITSCFIGLDEDEDPHGNRNGIFIETGATGTQIGDGSVIGRNVISGNLSSGIIIRNSGTSNTQILGNIIGLNSLSQTLASIQPIGIRLFNNVTNTTIGDGTSDGSNIIAGHGSDGILISNGSFNNTISHNSIYNNNNSGINIASGNQMGVNPPRNLSFDAATSTLSGESAVGYNVEVYADESTEGRMHLGTFNVSISPWDFVVDTTGFGSANLKYLTTIQDSASNTSAFSDTIPIIDPCLGFEVTLGSDIDFACEDTTLNAGSFGGTPIYSWYATGARGSVLGTTQLFNISGAQNQSYTVEVDSAGCIATDDIFVTIYNKPSFTISGTDPICFGSNDGEINLNNSFFSGDYNVSYLDHTSSLVNQLITSSSGTITINSLQGGNYTNIIVDSAGCKSDASSFNLTEPTQVAFTATKFSDPTCQGFDGQIQIGGLLSGASYSISYTDPQFGQMNLSNMTASGGGDIFLSGLDVGAFGDFAVTDANGCQATDAGPVNLDTPTLGLFTVSESHPTNCSSPDGTLTIGNLISGQFYSVDYNHPTLGVQNLSSQEAISPGEIVIGGLEEGDYNSFVVSSGIHCSENDFNTYTLSNPVGPIFTPTKFSDPTCQGFDGQIQISGLMSGGSYSVTYTDPQFGQTNFSNMVAGGSGEILLSGLDVGAFSDFEVIDENGCQATDAGPVNLDTPTLGLFTVSESHPTNCSSSDGSLTIGNLISGQFYSVDYDHPVFGAQSLSAQEAVSPGEIVISGLEEGDYDNIVVSSGTHCSESDFNTYTLTNPAGPSFSLTSNGPSCDGVDGDLTISGLTSGGDYTVQYHDPFFIRNGPNPHQANTSGEIVISSLDTGAFVNFQVTDVISGCTSFDNAGITLPKPSFGSYSIIPVNPSCSGGDGVITINTFHLNTTIDVQYIDPSLALQSTPGLATSGSGEAQLTGLSQGDYSDFQLTRGAHCQVSESISYTLTQSAPPSFSLSQTDPSCQGFDGSITISSLAAGESFNVSYDDPSLGSQGPLSLSSSTGGEIILSGLDVGDFTNFQVINSGGCVGTNSGPVTLNTPTLGLFTVTTTPASCVGNDGSLTISGLTSASNYNIGYDDPSFLTVGPNPETTNTSGEITFTGLEGGDYRNIQVIQGPHCAEIDAAVYSIGAPNNPVFSVDPKDPTCSGNDGELTIGNLTSGESYNISFVLPDFNTVGPVLLTADGIGEIAFTGLSSGAYTNVVVDSSGCSTQDSGPFDLVDPINPIVTFDHQNPTCSGGGNNGELYILGLTNGKTYDVSYNGAVQVIGASPINDTLTVTGFAAGSIPNIFVDSLGCTSNATTINFVNPAAPTIGVSIKSPTCTGNDGVLELFNLDNATIYDVTYDDGSVQNVSLQPTSDTIKILGISGGTVITNITVDSSGCQSNLVTGPYEFSSPELPAISVTKNDPTCSGGDGWLAIVGLDNSHAYNVFYDDGSAQNIIAQPVNDTIFINGIGGGTSIINLFVDSLGCQSNTITGPINFIDPVGPVVAASSNDPSCAGGNGSITISGLQSGIAYDVSYDNPARVGPNSLVASGGSIVISGLSAGSYSNLTIDSLGCSTVVPGVFTLANPQLSPFTIAKNDPSCVDGDGSLVIQGLGNTTTYHISYDDHLSVNQIDSNVVPNLSGEIIISNLFAGDYTNFVLDSSGCVNSDNGTYSLTLPTVLTSIEIAGDTIVCEGTASNFSISAQANEGSSPTYAWYENGLSAGAGLTHSSTFSASGELVVEMTPSESCASPAYDTVQVVVNPLPVTNTISGPSEVCDSQTGVAYNVTGALNSTYSWSTQGGAIVNGNTSSVTVDFSSTDDQLFVTETTNQGCVGTQASFPVLIQNITTGSINGALQPDCGEQGVEYSVSGTIGSTFLWTAPTGTSIGLPSDSSTVFLDFGNFNGNITVQEVSAIGCSGSISSILTDLQNCALTANINFDRDTICVGDSILVQSISSGTSGVTSFKWDFGTGTSNQSNLVEGPHYVKFITAGTDSVKLSLENNTAVKHDTTFAVYVIDFPGTVLSIVGPDTVCDGETGVNYSIADIAGSTFTWSVPNGAVIQSGQGTNSISVDFGSVSGNVAVQETNFAGCEGSVYSKIIEIRTVPGITPVSGPSSMCVNTDSVNYSAAISLQTTQYNWSVPSDATILEGGTSNAIKVTFGEVSGYVIVTPENQCGLGMADTIQVQLDSLPENPGPISGNLNVCNNQPENYSIDPLERTDIYNWTVPSGASIVSGTGTNQITVDFGNSGGEISVTPSNSSCIGQTSDTSSIVIALDSLSSLGSIDGPTSTCNNTLNVDYSVIGFDNADNYQWILNGASSTSDLTASSIQVDFSGTDASIYVVASNSCGITDTAKIDVTIGSLVATITPSADQSVCVGTDVVLTASGGATGATYQWFNNGAPLAETTSQLTVSSSSSIHVEITETTGCSGLTDTVEVSVNNLPEVELGPDLFDCDSVAVSINALGDHSYEWYQGGTLFSTDTLISYTTTASNADFILVVTNTSTNCANSDTINLAIGSELLVKGLPTENVTFCSGESTTMTVTNTGVLTYQWYKDNVAIVDETSASIMVSEEGNYFVELTKGSCGGTSESVFVDVFELPVIGLKNVSACRGSEVTLSVPNYGAGFSYLWQDSTGTTVSTDTSVVSSAEGKYDFDITITDTSGCTNTQNVEVAIQHQFGVAAQAFETTQNDFEVYVDVLNHIQNGALADNYFTLTADVDAAVTMDVNIIGDSIVRVIPPQNFSGQAVLTYAIENQCQVRKTGSINLQITPNSVDDTISEFEPERLVIPISDILDNDFGSIVFDSLRFEEFTEVFGAQVSINFVKQTIILSYDPAVYDTLPLSGKVDSVKYYICDESSCDSAYLKIFIQKIPEVIETENVQEDSVRVVVYNAVSPNEDGYQDYLLIEFYFNDEEAVPASSTFNLYNIWGDLVSEIEGYNSYASGSRFEGYDLDGAELEDGTYYFTLEFEIDNGKRIKIYNENGFIVMKR